MGAFSQLPETFNCVEHSGEIQPFIGYNGGDFHTVGFFEIEGDVVGQLMPIGGGDFAPLFLVQHFYGLATELGQGRIRVEENCHPGKIHMAVGGGVVQPNLFQALIHPAVDEGGQQVEGGARRGLEIGVVNYALLGVGEGQEGALETAREVVVVCEHILAAGHAPQVVVGAEHAHSVAVPCDFAAQGHVPVAPERARFLHIAGGAGAVHDIVL